MLATTGLSGMDRFIGYELKIMNTIEELRPIQYEIIKEITRAFDRLGGEVGLFAALGSWGDTLPEEDVLSLLRSHNDNMESGARDAFLSQRK